MLPKILYNALPYLYFSAGFFALFSLEAPVGYLSVAAFTAAGLLVLLMRRAYRQ